MVLSERITVMDHLIQNHYLDKATGKLLFIKLVGSNQPKIKEYPEARSLNINYNFNNFKAFPI